MAHRIGTLTVATLALVALAASGALAGPGEPPARPQAGGAQAAPAQDPGALRVSPGVRPTFKLVGAIPVHGTLAWAGPDLVPLEPRIGGYAGQVTVSGQAVGAWEIYWRAKNQGGKPTAANSDLRATCTPMNVNPALPPQTKMWISALMCEWLNASVTVPKPLAAGAVFEKLSWITYPTNVPCTAAHPRVTVRVDTFNAVDEGPREGNNERTYDFCQ